MSEIDVMRNLENCIKLNCEGCPRASIDSCRNEIMRDAVCAIREQQKKLASSMETIKEQHEKLNGYKAFDFYNLTIDDLIKDINSIIANAVVHEEDDDNMFYLIMAMKRLTENLRLIHSEIVFDYDNNYPQIRIKNTEACQ